MAQGYLICFPGTKSTADSLSAFEGAREAVGEDQGNGALTIHVGLDLGPMVSLVDASSIAVLMGNSEAPGSQVKIYFLFRTDRQKDKVERHANENCLRSAKA